MGTSTPLDNFVSNKFQDSKFFLYYRDKTTRLSFVVVTSSLSLSLSLCHTLLYPTHSPPPPVPRVYSIGYTFPALRLFILSFFHSFSPSINHSPLHHPNVQNIPLPPPSSNLVRRRTNHVNCSKQQYTRRGFSCCALAREINTFTHALYTSPAYSILCILCI